MLPSAKLQIGPAGWSHPHWNALVYPQPKPRGFHSLEYLSKYFNAIEITSSFHQDLRPEVTRLWIQKIGQNPAFQFTAKLHRRFTHERLLDPEGIAAFKAGLWPLLHSRRLGALLMQFPWSFRFTAENREFLIRLRRAFHEFPLVAEMRHVSWMRDEALGVFIDYNIGFCNIDQPTYTKAMPPTAFLTTGTGYVRLHGRSCFNWYQDNSDPLKAHRYDYLYSELELAEWTSRIERIGRHAERVFVITNNDAGGKAVVNALQLQTMLGVSVANAPKELLRKFPAAQSSLFTEYRGQAVA
jgi:uncharacterized protein YecE (DUF72 family)